MGWRTPMRNSITKVDSAHRQMSGMVTSSARFVLLSPWLSVPPGEQRVAWDCLDEGASSGLGCEPSRPSYLTKKDGMDEKRDVCRASEDMCRGAAGVLFLRSNGLGTDRSRGGGSLRSNYRARRASKDA